MSRPVHRSDRPRLVLLVGLAALVGAGCASADPDDASPAGAEADDQGEPVRVVATTSILGDIVAELVGDDGEVTVLMGPGVDPHGYEPSARDAVTMREADLVVANGLDLEEGLISVLESAEADGVRVFELAPQLDPIEFGDDHDHDHGDDHGHGDDDHDHGDHDHGDHDHDHGDDDHDHGHGDDGGHDDHHDHDHGPEDPHVWFDPERMATGTELLAAELADVAPQVDDWQERGAAYADRLRELDEQLTARFADLADDRRTIVTNHDSLGYLAARYDLEVLGTVIPGASTNVDADAASFAALVAAIEEAGVTTIFAENTDSTQLAEQLANEVVGRADLDVEVVRIATDALGEPGTPAGTYLGLLEDTATTIAAALED